jgi:hypothetical protein
MNLFCWTWVIAIIPLIAAAFAPGEGLHKNLTSDSFCGLPTLDDPTYRAQPCGIAFAEADCLVDREFVEGGCIVEESGRCVLEEGILGTTCDNIDDKTACRESNYAGFVGCVWYHVPQPTPVPCTASNHDEPIEPEMKSPPEENASDQDDDLPKATYKWAVICVLIDVMCLSALALACVSSLCFPDRQSLFLFSRGDGMTFSNYV